MPLHPEIQTMIDALAALGLPPLVSLSPQAARVQYLRMARRRLPTKAVVGAVGDRVIPGPGGDLPLRVYVPRPTTGERPPLLTYFHGGGFVIGDLETHDNACRELCAGAGCVVVAVDYRLAPEHKFPAAVDDCLAATRWAGAHAAELGADPTRIAVGGDSAGGNLATVVAARVRDEGGPALCAQLLVYPVTDHYSRETASLRENAVGYVLTRESMVWFADHYLRGPADVDHPQVAPLRAASLRGLPPAWLAIAEYDPLRDEGEAYAARLRADGVETELVRYAGAIHGIYTAASMLEPGRRMMEDSCRWLRKRFEV